MSVAAPPRPAYQPAVAAPLSAAPLAAPGADYSRNYVADPSKVLGVGDQVTFSIAEDRDLPVSLRVTDTGELDIPYIGRVSVSGKTSAEVSGEIKRRLEAKYYYSATVQLGIDQVNRAAAVEKIYVSGLVTVPGPQDVYPGDKLTVSNVIVRAGGFKTYADSRKVKVTRKGRGGSAENFIVDVKAILEKGDLSKDMELRGGDFVNVPQRLINW